MIGPESGEQLMFGRPDDILVQRLREPIGPAILLVAGLLMAVLGYSLQQLTVCDEGDRLSPAERHDVLRATITAAAGRVPVVAGTNAGSTRDVVEYSRQAERLGAVGVLLAPPYHSLPRPDELFEHFRAVNDAIGIPIMLYNYPGRTGVDMLPDFIERLAALANVRYVKESTGETVCISTLIRRCGDRLGVLGGAATADECDRLREALGGLE